MKKAALLNLAIALAISLQAQHVKVSAGPEALRSFNHDETFWGVGGSVQADFWIKKRLWLGVNSGYLKFDGSSNDYAAVPALGVIKYPLPVLAGLYGEDLFGYTFVKDVSFEKNGNKAKGGFTYYFALGYEFADHFDVSLKVGRTRLNKKNDPVNVNEHNLGLRLAYLF